MTHYPNSDCEKHRDVTTNTPICLVCLAETIEQRDVEIEQLKDALRDMMQLISEHGGKTIQAHATRIGKAFKVLEGIK